MKEGYYIINRKGNYLTCNPATEFCSGIRGFSKNSAILFETEKEADQYISNLMRQLHEWIEKDIPEQLQNWRLCDREDFLKESQERYIKNKKIINSLKIINYFPQ